MKILLYILIFYFVAKIIMRFLAPLMARKMMEKAAKNFEEQFNNPYYKEKPDVKEGETIIEKKGQEKTTPRTKGSGEYVDYEEID